MIGENSAVTPARIARFRRLVLDAYRERGRHDLPWRHTTDPWAVLLSEVMLQQTQVARVRTRFEPLLERFPTPDALAAAPLAEVLAEWQGLGYNRRAVALRRCAVEVSERHGGCLPDDERALRALPGIGPATAAGVLVFAHDRPAVYLETNVRAVFLHHFFEGRDDVSDREIVPLVAATLLEEDPRTWYWALLDHGAELKRTVPNPSRRSRHHARQSRFEGSRRQKRARLLRSVLASPGALSSDLAADAGGDAALAEELLEELLREGFLERSGEGWRVAG